MADSVCEAEYITASDAEKEAVWLQKFIDELGVAPSIDGPILLYYEHPPLMAPFCYTTIILQPLLKPRSQGPIC